MPRSTNPNLKRANEQISYTPEQVYELKKCMQDPVYFISTYIKVQHPVKGAITFEPREYAKGMISTFYDNRKSIILAPRQIGKCNFKTTKLNIVYKHDWRIDKQTITIGELHEKYNPDVCNIYSNGELKFIEETYQDNIYVETPYGYSRIKKSLKTVSYRVYEISLENGTSLRCADEHIVMCSGIEVCVKDLIPNESIVDTKFGSSLVLSVNDLGFDDNMYDLELDDEHHVYYTNDILSHNTATVGAYLLWFAIFHFDKTVLIASNKNDNAMEIIDRIQYAYEELPMWLKPGVTEDGWNKHSIGFDNKSRIVSCATSATSGRGMSISLLFVDEFAFVAPNVQEEFWKSMSPTLATGGACIIASTPNGDQNKFAQLWRTAEMGVGEYAPITVAWNDPPDRDDDFKQNIIATEGTLHWLQEYECKFLSSDALLIDSMVLANLSEYVDTIKPIREEKEFIFFKELQPDSTYLVAVDPATGSGEDFSVIEVFDFPQLTQVAEFRSNTTSMPELYTKLNWILHTLKNVNPDSKLDDEKGNIVYYSVENNGIGQGLITLIERSLDGYFLKDGERGLDSPCFEFVSDNPKKYGVVTTPKSKIRSCINLKELTERGKIGIKSKILMKELKTYVKRSNTYQAQRGSTDDAVSATLIILRILEEISDYEEAAFDKLYSYDSDDYYNYAHDNDEDAGDGEPLPIIM